MVCCVREFKPELEIFTKIHSMCSISCTKRLTEKSHCEQSCCVNTFHLKSFPWIQLNFATCFCSTIPLRVCRLYQQAAVVHLNFRGGSTFLVPVCTVPGSMDRTSRCNKVDAVRLYASYRLNLLLLKGQRCVLRGCRLYQEWNH